MSVAHLLFNACRSATLASDFIVARNKIESYNLRQFSSQLRQIAFASRRSVATCLLRQRLKHRLHEYSFIREALLTSRPATPLIGWRPSRFAAHTPRRLADVRRTIGLLRLRNHSSRCRPLKLYTCLRSVSLGQ